jgi:diguanylate cyclase (GGDEF)-like protein/PAS domain S-box-containing protein
VQWRDVTADRVDLSTAHHERDLMYAMMDKVHDAMFFKDLESRYIRVNTSMAQRLGLNDPALAVGMSDADFYSAEHADITRLEELNVMTSRMPLLNQVHRETWADGRETWNVSMKMPLLDTQGQVIGTYGIAHDITEQKRNEANTWHQANFDALTNLPNRRLLLDRWEQAVNSHRRSGHTLALMLLDLDHFKAVNDTLGHAMGDMLLVQASERVSACLRSTDTLARLGGDEFAIILTDVVDVETVGRIAQKIVDCLCQPFDLAGQQATISGSIGISRVPQQGTHLDDLMRIADQAMYQAKALGRNGYCLASAATQDAAV